MTEELKPWPYGPMTVERLEQAGKLSKTSVLDAVTGVEIPRVVMFDLERDFVVRLKVDQDGRLLLNSAGTDVRPVGEVRPFIFQDACGTRYPSKGAKS